MVSTPSVLGALWGASLEVTTSVVSSLVCTGAVEVGSVVDGVGCVGEGFGADCVGVGFTTGGNAGGVVWDDVAAGGAVGDGGGVAVVVVDAVTTLEVVVFCPSGDSAEQATERSSAGR